MSNDGSQKPFETPIRGDFLDTFRMESSIKTKLRFMAIAIALFLATAFIVTVAGLNYVENIHTSAIKNENVFHGLMEIKASALSTIMLDPASPDTEAVFADAGRKIQNSSRSARENIDQREIIRGLDEILSQYRNYERDSTGLFRLATHDPKAAKEGVLSLYKLKFIPFQNGLESFIAKWSAIAERVERDAAESIRAVKWSVSILLMLIAGAIIVMMLAVTRSINVNLRAREESLRRLRQSEALLSATQSMAKIGGWEYDVTGDTLFWTDEVYRIHDFAREQMSSASAAEHIDKSLACYTPESRRVIQAAFQKCVAEGIPYDMEFPFTSEKGRQMWIRTSGVPIFEGDKVVKIIGDIMDITDLRRAEEELRQFFNLVPDMVCIASTGGYFVKINPMWEKTLGYAEEELLTTPFLEFIHPDDRAATMKEVARQIGGEATIEFVNRYRCKDGDYKWLEWMAIPSPDKKQLFAAARDITERRAAEEKLKMAKDAAEEATKVKDKFVSLVAHDLKSPLSGMIGFLQVLRKDAAKPLDDGVNMILDRVIDAGKQMARLIDDLLNLNRLKTGQLKLDKQFFDAKYLGAKMCADLSYSAESKGITLSNLIPENSHIFADRTLMTEALQNLVTNAIKFCRKGDSITISLSETGHTAIMVKDTGPGMPPEMLERLFKYDAKVSTVGTNGEIGTGFGLPLAKDIMLLHGGDLEAASEVGKGCIFTLKIPHDRPLIIQPDVA